MQAKEDTDSRRTRKEGDMKVHFIQQDPWVTPGEYLCWAERNGWDVTCTRCWQREAVPEAAEADYMSRRAGGGAPV